MLERLLLPSHVTDSRQDCQSQRVILFCNRFFASQWWVDDLKMREVIEYDREHTDLPSAINFIDITQS